MPRLEQLVVAHRERARADEAHLAAQDVQHLRDLVEREAAQERPDARDARVVLDLEERALGLVATLELRLLGLGVGAHRPELDHPELLLVQADSAVAVEDRPARVELDRERDQGPEREADDRDQRADDEVEAALHEPVCSDEDRRAQLEQRHALTGHVLASALDQELRRPRGDTHLHPTPVRLLDDLHQLAVAEVRVGDDQLVDLVRCEHGRHRRGRPERDAGPRCPARSRARRRTRSRSRRGSLRACA